MSDATGAVKGGDCVACCRSVLQLLCSAEPHRVRVPEKRANHIGYSDGRLARFGLKRGKLLYVFKHPQHDVERDKHRNVITRARFIKAQLETAGYRLIPWDFKKGQPPRFWSPDDAMEDDDDDLYGPTEPVAPNAAPKEEPRVDDDASSGDEPMDEGDESGDDDDEDSDSVRRPIFARACLTG